MKCLNKSRFSTLFERSAQFVLLLAGALLFTGCELGPKYKTPAVATPPAYKELGNWKTAQPNDQNLGGNWWEVFQDPQLNTLEEQINVSNQNLKAAVAQYQESRAAVRYVRADYYPTVTTSPSATRERYSNNRPPHSSGFDGLSFNDFVLPVNVSYEANIWGRVSRNVGGVPRAGASIGCRPGRRQSQHACDPGCRLLRCSHPGRRREAVARYSRPVRTGTATQRGPVPGRSCNRKSKSSRHERYWRQREPS